MAFLTSVPLILLSSVVGQFHPLLMFCKIVQSIQYMTLANRESGVKTQSYLEQIHINF